MDSTTLSFTDSKYSSLSSTTPNISITIPEDKVADFLGIMVLDILHDAKGYGHLAGGKLAQLTDLLAAAAIITDDIEKESIPVVENFFFKKVLDYFVELWADNLGALGLDSIPIVTGDNIDILKRDVMLPIRRVANRVDDDTFVRLGKGSYGIEAYNYRHQKAKFTGDQISNIEFISPVGINSATDYFNRAITVVNFIRQQTNPSSRVSLDMKSSAGLIRTITDPIGYATGLPTYADPGYNMPGMSAIRKNSAITFNNIDTAEEFRYVIKLDGSPLSRPITFLDTTYHYGVIKNGLDRSNLLVNIVGNTFKSTLPRSGDMAETLGRYLRPAPKEISEPLSDVLGILEYLIWNYYEAICPKDNTTEAIVNVYKSLSNKQNMTLDTLTALMNDTTETVTNVYRWCQYGCSQYRTSYILSTIQNLYHFDIEKYLPSGNYYLPEYMITTLLPSLMYMYNIEENWDINIIAFCYHQLKLISQYVNNVNSSETTRQKELKELLYNQWLPKRRGKLTIQIEKAVKAWRNDQMYTMLDEKEYLKKYISQLLTTCKNNLGTMILLDDLEDIEDSRLEVLLGKLPIFKPTKELKRSLLNHLKFYRPEIYHRCKTLIYDGLLLSTFLDTILWKKPLLNLDINLQELITTVINPNIVEYRYEQYIQESLGRVVGKFSGDFGQIVWCMCYGNLFASEDSNAAAMSLLMQQLPKLNIHLRDGIIKRWGNIYGHGDGSTVDVNIIK